jgi:hypothetical protein
MLRREMQQFDEVLEGYRRNLYALRRLMLSGSADQRQRAIHLYIQVGFLGGVSCEGGGLRVEVPWGSMGG